ncbi:MAG: GNAT family N-acetyltransferase [Bacillota bacterium]
MRSNGYGEQIRKLDITDAKIARQVFALQKNSYRVEAEIIGSHEIPPLMESLEELMTSGETFLGCYERREIVAVLSYKRDSKLVDIHRMMVHPNHFRKGIARHLLAHLEENETGVHELTVSTGSANIPAINLYEKLGFKKVGNTVVGEGLSLTQFFKTIG